MVDEGWISVSSIEEAKEKIDGYETATTTRFCCVRAARDFGRTDPSAKPHKVLWKDGHIPFSGVPFFVLGEKLLECHHGKDRNIGTKKKYQQNLKENGSGDHGYVKKKKKLVQNTKKLDCPAQIYMREVIFFPEYKISEDSERKRKSSSTRIRTAIKEGAGISSERRIYIHFPDKDSHKNHILGEASGIQQQMDPKVAEKIQYLVGKGIHKVSEMRRHLREYLGNDLFCGQELPPSYNRRFFPSKKDLRNHIYRAVVQNRFSKCDQTNVSAKVEEWQRQHPKDMFCFRPYAGRHHDHDISAPEDPSNDDEDSEEEVKVTSTTSKQSLLFVHQTDWQRRLLGRYGNHICLLDATYRTTRYSLPLFFLAVKTNVDYQVVGSFIVQHETTEAIREALQKLKDWNPSWKPQFFMTDLSEQEINAVEDVHPDTTLYLCDFHREQAWERWVSKAANGVSYIKEEVLCHIRRVAHAASPEKYHDAVKSLMSSHVWIQHPKLQCWFKKTWLRNYKKWVWAFRCESFILGVNTNNGLERQNQVFKYTYLQHHKNNSLSGMLSILIEEFLPDNYNRYVEMNVKYCEGYRKYSTDVPHYLVNRPRILVAHCTERIFAAGEIESYHTQCVDDINGVFKIKSQSQEGKWYHLTFGDLSNMCRCECKDWQKWWLPCKHFIAVFNHYPGWQWENLSPLYQSSPFFSLDEELISQLQQPPRSITPQSEDQIASKVPATGDGSQVLNHEVDEVPDASQHVFQEARTQEVGHPLPLQRKHHRSEAPQCRDLLAQLRCATFLVHNPEALTTLRRTLSEALSQLRSYIHHEDGIELEGPQKPKPKRKHCPVKELSDLPPPPKQAKYARRHGKKANEIRKLTGVKVGIDQLSKPVVFSATPEKDAPVKEPVDEINVRDEEVRLVDRSDEEEAHMGNTSDNPQKSCNHTTTEEKEEYVTKEEDVNQSEEKKEEETIEGEKTIVHEAVHEQDDGDIEITGVTTTEVPLRRKRFMDNEELSIIRNARCLTDTSINVAQNMLHEQFPQCDGLEDTTLGPLLQFSVQGSEFVQVLHNGSMHWVCVSNIGCKPGEINYFDSLFNGTIKPYVKKQIAALLNERGPEIRVNVQPVQQQTNGVDCGPYSLAFATSLLNAEDPACLTYNEKRLREHLLHCFTTKFLSPFPQNQPLNRRRHRRAPKRTFVIDLYCLCRMPWDEADQASPDLRMAQCDKCDRWVHKKCANIPEEVFRRRGCFWACPICLP